MNSIAKQFAGALLLAMALGAATRAHAASYPSRDITFIVPYKPGGSTDPISRQFAAQLKELLGGNINVENKPGGSATIGTAAIITARPDGYTIGLGSNSSLAYQSLVKNSLPYKTTNDYEPIIKLAELPAVLSVRADAPWKTFAEFLAAVKKNPGKIRASVSGLRTAPDLVTQLFNKVSGLKITTVPFTGGGGEALIALLGGRVEANVGYGASVKGQVEAGKVRVLAVFQKDKYDLFPDATPVGELGYKAFLPAMYCVIAPKGLPADVLAKLTDASRKAVRSDAFVKFARDNGYVVDPKGPEALKAELDGYRSTFEDLIKFLGPS